MTPAPLPDASLAQTLHSLWPGLEWEVVRSSRRDPSAHTELVAFPGLARQRLLLPASPRAAGAALRRFSAAAGKAQVSARVAAGAALRYGGESLLRDRVRLHGSGETILEHLAEVLGRDRVQVSLSLGPPRVNRKPVLQVFDEHGRSLAFAKVGSSSASAAVVADEARALATLESRTFRTLRAPRVLGIHTWRGMPVLVQEDLAVSASSLLRGTGATPARAMNELTDAFPSAGLPLTESPWWHECRQRAGRARDHDHRDRLLAAMDTVAQRWPHPVALSAWHGDWTPWNCADSSGRVLVWDWERFETGVPTGMDAVHYAVNAATGDGTSAAAVVAAVRASAPDPVTGALYLVAVSARYLAMTGEEHGALARPRAEHTLRALEAQLRQGR